MWEPARSLECPPNGQPPPLPIRIRGLQKSPWRVDTGVMDACFWEAEHGTPDSLKKMLDRGERYDRSIFEYLVKAGKLDMLKMMSDVTKYAKLGGDWKKVGKDKRGRWGNNELAMDWIVLYKLAIETPFPEIAAYVR